MRCWKGGRTVTKAEFAVIAATIRSAYSWAKLMENEQATEIWYRKLSDIPVDVLVIVVDKWLETKNQPPTIADLRAEAARTVNGETPIWTDGWEQVRKAISAFGYMQKEKALDSMDELTAATVQRLGWQQICESENVDAIRANFRMTYETLARRKEEGAVLSERTRLNTEKIQALVSGTAKELSA